MKFTGICIILIWVSLLLNGYFNFLTRYIVDGYVKKATRSLDLYSHGFKSLNAVSNKNKI